MPGTFLIKKKTPEFSSRSSRRSKSEKLAVLEKREKNIVDRGTTPLEYSLRILGN